MSEAKVRAIRETRLVEVNLNEPVLSMPPTDRRHFSINPNALNFCDYCAIDREGNVVGCCPKHRDPANATARAVRALLNEIVQSAYNNALGREEGAIWATWRIVLDDIDETEGAAIFRIPYVHVHWMTQHLSNKDIKVRSGFVQWREATIDYFRKLEDDEEL